MVPTYSAIYSSAPYPNQVLPRIIAAVGPLMITLMANRGDRRGEPGATCLRRIPRLSYAIESGASVSPDSLAVAPDSRRTFT